MFYRANHLWNDEHIHSSFPERKCSPDYPIFSEIKSSLKLVALNTFTLHFPKIKPSLKLVAVFELLVPPAPDWLEFFELFKCMLVFKLFDRPSTFRIGSFLVFELFDQPSTFRIGIFLVFVLFYRPSTFRIDLNFFVFQLLYNLYYIMLYIYYIAIPKTKGWYS